MFDALKLVMLFEDTLLPADPIVPFTCLPIRIALGSFTKKPTQAPKNGRCIFEAHTANQMNVPLHGTGLP